MGQGPLVLKATQALGPVQIVGKRQVTPQQGMGGKEGLSLFHRQGN